MADVAMRGAAPLGAGRHAGAAPAAGAAAPAAAGAAAAPTSYIDRIGVGALSEIDRPVEGGAKADTRHDFGGMLVKIPASSLKSSKTNDVSTIRREIRDKRLEPFITGTERTTQFYDYIKPLLPYILPPHIQSRSFEPVLDENGTLKSLNFLMKQEGTTKGLLEKLQDITRPLTSGAATDANILSALNTYIYSVSEAYTVGSKTRTYNISGRPAKITPPVVQTDDDDESGKYATISTLFTQLTGVDDIVCIIDATNLSGKKFRQLLDTNAPASPVTIHILLSTENMSDPATKITELKAATNDLPNVTVEFLEDTGYHTHFGPATSTSSTANVMEYLFSSMGLRTYQSTDRNVTGEITFSNGETITINNLGEISEIAKASVRALQQIISYGTVADIVAIADARKKRDIIERIVVYIFLKRCGDWCQALCLLDRHRVYKRKRDGLLTSIAQIYASKAGRVAVFLMTHDKVLLAYCIMLGINVLFTTKYLVNGWSIVWALYLMNVQDRDPAAEASYKAARIARLNAWRTALTVPAPAGDIKHTTDTDTTARTTISTLLTSRNITTAFEPNLGVYIIKLYLILYALQKYKSNPPPVPMANLPNLTTRDVTIAELDTREKELEAISAIYSDNKVALDLLTYAYSITDISGGFTPPVPAGLPIPSKLGEFARNSLMEFKALADTKGVNFKMNEYLAIEDLFKSDISEFARSRKTDLSSSIKNNLIPASTIVIPGKRTRGVTYNTLRGAIDKWVSTQAGGAVSLSEAGISNIFYEKAPIQHITYEPIWEFTRESLDDLFTGVAGEPDKSTVLAWAKRVFDANQDTIQEPELTTLVRNAVGEYLQTGSEASANAVVTSWVPGIGSYTAYERSGTRIQDALGNYFTAVDVLVDSRKGEKFKDIFANGSFALTVFLGLDIQYISILSKTIVKYQFPVYRLDILEESLNNIDKSDGTFSPRFILTNCKYMLRSIANYIDVYGSYNQSLLAPYLLDISMNASIEHPPEDITGVSVVVEQYHTIIAQMKLLLILKHYEENVNRFQLTTEQYCDLISTVLNVYWVKDGINRDYTMYWALFSKILQYYNQFQTLSYKKDRLRHRVMNAVGIMSILSFLREYGNTPSGTELYYNPCLFGGTFASRCIQFAKAFYYASTNVSYHSIMPFLLAIMKNYAGDDIDVYNSLFLKDFTGEDFYERAKFHSLPFLFKNSDTVPTFSSAYVTPSTGIVNLVKCAELIAIIENSATVFYDADLKKKIASFRNWYISIIGSTAAAAALFTSLINRIVHRQAYDKLDASIVGDIDDPPDTKIDIGDISEDCFPPIEAAAAAGGLADDDDDLAAAAAAGGLADDDAADEAAGSEGLSVLTKKEFYRKHLPTAEKIAGLVKSPSASRRSSKPTSNKGPLQRATSAILSGQYSRYLKYSKRRQAASSSPVVIIPMPYPLFSTVRTDAETTEVATYQVEPRSSTGKANPNPVRFMDLWGEVLFGEDVPPIDSRLQADMPIPTPRLITPLVESLPGEITDEQRRIYISSIEEGFEKLLDNPTLTVEQAVQIQTNEETFKGRIHAARTNEDIKKIVQSVTRYINSVAGGSAAMAAPAAAAAMAAPAAAGGAAAMAAPAAAAPAAAELYTVSEVGAGAASKRSVRIRGIDEWINTERRLQDLYDSGRLRFLGVDNYLNIYKYLSHENNPPYIIQWNESGGSTEGPPVTVIIQTGAAPLRITKVEEVPASDPRDIMGISKDTRDRIIKILRMADNRRRNNYSGGARRLRRTRRRGDRHRRNRTRKHR